MFVTRATVVSYKYHTRSLSSTSASVYFFTEIVRYFTAVRYAYILPAGIVRDIVFSPRRNNNDTCVYRICLRVLLSVSVPRVCVTPFATSSPKPGIACFVFGTGKKYSEIIDTSPRMDGRRIHRIYCYYGRHNTTPRSHARDGQLFCSPQPYFRRSFPANNNNTNSPKIRRLAHITQIYIIGVYIKK